MSHTLFDTSVISRWMRQDNVITLEIQRYLGIYGFLPVSVLTLYEIQRGILSCEEEGRRRLSRVWDRLSQNVQPYPLTHEIAEEAARLWCLLGAEEARKIGDADLLIAATALHFRFRLATENRKRFELIPSLSLESWAF